MAVRIYSGKIINLELETVDLPDGSRCELEIVRHPGGAAVAAVDAQERLCLLRQYRHVAGDWLWELPAGKLDRGESPLRTAQRELSEEAGITARNWLALGRLYSSPGVFSEQLFLYLAQDLSLGEAHTEPGECIEVHWLPLHEAVQWALQGIISDSKTLAGVVRAWASLHPGFCHH